MSCIDYPSWPQLAAHAKEAKAFNLKHLFSEDENRHERFQVEAAGLFLDYSKNLVDTHTLQLFSAITKEAGLPEAIRAMMQGQHVNTSERRAALHTLLRTDIKKQIPTLKVESRAIKECLEKMARIAESVRTGTWRGHTNKAIKEIVHLGIGGSNLGPHMVDEALAPYRNKDGNDITCHYVANVDAHHISQVLAQLNAEETLVIIASKSFNTVETLENARTTRKWLLTHMCEDDLKKHIIAISSNIPAALEFGISQENILPMWNWVGGRYSLWSAVGLPLAIRYGFEAFRSLLDGAAAMDDHFETADFENNMPMILAWISLWYQHFFNAQSHAVIPYDHGLRLLPAHLQQLDMESNGKQVKQNGGTIDYPTGAIIWGGEGSNGQHAFHQLLHQGNRFVGIDFILPLQAHHDHQSHHDQLVASCLSQSQALMQGQSAQQMASTTPSALKKHKLMPGNRPSNTITVNKLEPFTLGSLIALYEHKVFCQATIWQINPFDQWGVELGKALGDKIYTAIVDEQYSSIDQSKFDPSTISLLNKYKRIRQRG